MKSPSNHPVRFHGRRIGSALVGTALLAMVAATAATPLVAQEPEAPKIPETPSFIPESELQNLRSEERAAESRARQKQIDEALTPPDGKWLVDEDGKEYFVQSVPKVEGHFRWVDDKTVRLRHGATLKLVDHDDENFYVKVFKSNFVPQAYNQPPKPTEEQIAAVEAAYTVSLANADTLTFTPFDRGLPRTGQWRNGFDLADMNGDGVLDLIHGPMRKGAGSPHIFLSDGNGDWRRWSEAKFERMRYDYGDVVAGDFNGDGNADIALAAHLRGITVLVGDGEGQFSQWSEGLVFGQLGHVVENAHFTSRAIGAGDWDGDGRTDLMALSEGPRHPKAMDRAQVENPLGVVIYKNGSDGKWSVQEALGGQDEIFGDALTIGDFNGDKRPDLAVATNAQGRRNLLFMNPGASEAPQSLELPSLRPNALVWDVEAADVDRDGLDDLVIAFSAIELGTWRTGVDIFFSRMVDGKAHWTRVPLAAREDGGKATYSTTAAGDLDGDGVVDIAAGTMSGTIEIYRGNESGGFTRELASGLPQPEAGCKVYDLAIRNLGGGDGGELVASLAGETCRSLGSLRAWTVTESMPAERTASASLSE